MENKDKPAEIYQVNEAFSMQPFWFTIGKTYHTGFPLKRIVIESIFDTGDPYDFYVGYDYDGNKVFAIRVQAANVQYRKIDELTL